MANQSTTEVAPQSAPRGVHIVDSDMGPLVGRGRFQRLAPFIATRVVCTAITLPTTTFVESVWVTPAMVLIVTMLVATVVLPWQRLPRCAQLAFPFSMLIGTLLLLRATGNDLGSSFITLIVVPLMWLAVYEHRNAVLVAVVLTGVALMLDPSTAVERSSADPVAFAAVLLVCCGGMAVTLHGLVADARRGATAQRTQQAILLQNAAVLDALPEPVTRYRVSDHEITYCNPAWATQYNITPTEAVGRTLDDFLSEDEATGLAQQLSLLGPDTPILVDSVARATGGANRHWLEWVDRYVVLEGVPEILSIGRDVTRRRNAELDLAETEAGFRDLADNSADVVWRFSLYPQPHFDYMSPSVEQMSGFPASFFLEDFSRISSVLDEEGRAAIAGAVTGDQLPDRFDITFRHADGSINIAETRTSRIRGGLQGVSRDVTELRRLQDEMATLALRDPLTGLANRRLFAELLDADLSRTERDKLPLAIAFLDLDGLKSVNDVHGHDAGDIVLRETSRRLRKVLRGADTVARLGGDEFAIIYAPNDSNSYNLIPRIDRALAEPIRLSATTSVTCPASIGVAETGTAGYSGAALLAAADEAMYQTKRARQAERGIEMART